jgi:hypothetical protein
MWVKIIGKNIKIKTKYHVCYCEHGILEASFRRRLDAEKSDEKKIRDRTEHRSTTVGWRVFCKEKNVRNSKKRTGVKIIGTNIKIKQNIDVADRNEDYFLLPILRRSSGFDSCFFLGFENSSRISVWHNNLNCCDPRDGYAQIS